MSLCRRWSRRRGRAVVMVTIAESPNRRGAAQWGGRDVGAGSRGAGRHFDSERAQSTPSLFGHVPRSRPVPLQAKMGRSRPAPAPQRERHKSASLPAAPERAAGPARASTPASGQGYRCAEPDSGPASNDRCGRQAGRLERGKTRARGETRNLIASNGSDSKRFAFAPLLQYNATCSRNVVVLKAAAKPRHHQQISSESSERSYAQWS